MAQLTPADAWQKMLEGNARFVHGAPAHPGQDAAKRVELSDGQNPFALVFGCADSRVAAEIIFDQGLGDLFVVRTAGHVIDPGVLGSVEFGVALLDIPLIIILGHDKCGAIGATLNATVSGHMPGGYIRDIVERVMPSAIAAKAKANGAEVGSEEVVSEHVLQSANLLVDRSKIVSEAIDAGKLAIVGVTYKLLDGAIIVEGVVGEV